MAQPKKAILLQNRLKVKIKTMRKTLLPILCVLSMMACNENKTTETQEGKGYKTPDNLKLESDVMTPEVLWSFGRLGGVSISPDGTKAVYGVTYFNKEEDRGYTDLYVMTLADGKVKQITDTESNEAEATWTPDGKHIAYIYKGQLWEMEPDGSNARQITNIEGGINGYVYAQDCIFEGCTAGTDREGFASGPSKSKSQNHQRPILSPLGRLGGGLYTPVHCRLCRRQTNYRR